MKKNTESPMTMKQPAMKVCYKAAGVVQGLSRFFALVFVAAVEALCISSKPAKLEFYSHSVDLKG